MKWTASEHEKKKQKNKKRLLILRATLYVSWIKLNKNFHNILDSKWIFNWIESVKKGEIKVVLLEKICVSLRIDWWFELNLNWITEAAWVRRI